MKYYLRGIGIGLLIAVILYSTVIIPQYKMTEEEIIERARELGMVMEEEDDIDLSALTGTPSPTEEAGLTPIEEPDLTPAEGADITPDPTEGAEASPPAPPDAPDAPGMPSGIPGPTGAAPSDGSGATEPTTSSGSSGITEPAAPSGGSGITEPAAPSGGSGITEPTAPSEPAITQDPKPTEPEAPPATGAISQPPLTPSLPGNNGKISITVVQGMNSDDFARLAQKVGLVEDAKDFDNYLMANGYAKELRAGTYLISAGATYEEIAKRVTARK